VIGLIGKESRVVTCTPEILQHIMCKNSGFTVQTVGETCVQCVRHSGPRHTAEGDRAEVACAITAL